MKNNNYNDFWNYSFDEDDNNFFEKYKDDYDYDSFDDNNYNNIISQEQKINNNNNSINNSHLKQLQQNVLDKKKNSNLLSDNSYYNSEKDNEKSFSGAFKEVFKENEKKEHYFNTSYEQEYKEEQQIGDKQVDKKMTKQKRKPNKQLTEEEVAKIQQACFDHKGEGWIFENVRLSYYAYRYKRIGNKNNSEINILDDFLANYKPQKIKRKQPVILTKEEVEKIQQACFDHESEGWIFEDVRNAYIEYRRIRNKNNQEINTLDDFLKIHKHNSKLKGKTYNRRSKEEREEIKKACNAEGVDYIRARKAYAQHIRKSQTPKSFDEWFVNYEPKEQSKPYDKRSNTEMQGDKQVDKKMTKQKRKPTKKLTEEEVEKPKRKPTEKLLTKEEVEKIRQACFDHKGEGWIFENVRLSYYRIRNKNNSEINTLDDFLANYKPNKQLTEEEVAKIQQACFDHESEGWIFEDVRNAYIEYRRIRNKNNQEINTLDDFLKIHKSNSKLKGKTYNRRSKEEREEIKKACNAEGVDYIRARRAYDSHIRKSQNPKSFDEWFVNYEPKEQSKPYDKRSNTEMQGDKQVDKKMTKQKRKRDKKYIESFEDIESFENKEIYNKKIKYDKLKNNNDINDSDINILSINNQSQSKELVSNVNKENSNVKENKGLSNEIIERIKAECENKKINYDDFISDYHEYQNNCIQHNIKQKSLDEIFGNGYLHLEDGLSDADKALIRETCDAKKCYYSVAVDAWHEYQNICGKFCKEEKTFNEWFKEYSQSGLLSKEDKTEIQAKCNESGIDYNKCVRQWCKYQNICIVINQIEKKSFYEWFKQEYEIKEINNNYKSIIKINLEEFEIEKQKENNNKEIKNNKKSLDKDKLKQK